MHKIPNSTYADLQALVARHAIAYQHATDQRIWTAINKLHAFKTMQHYRHAVRILDTAIFTVSKRLGSCRSPAHKSERVASLLQRFSHLTDIRDNLAIPAIN